MAAAYEGGSDMPQPTPALETRIALLEEHMRRVRLIVGAAGTMLAEVRRDDGDKP